MPDTPIPTPPSPEQPTVQPPAVATASGTLGLNDPEMEAISTVIRKASPLSVGMALVLSVLGGIVWFHRDVITKALDSSAALEKVQMQMAFNKQRAEIEFAALKSQHDHCQNNLKEVNESIRQLQSEVASLKAKLVAAQ